MTFLQPKLKQTLTLLQNLNHKRPFEVTHDLKRQSELYAVLTRLPLQPPISSSVAWQLIQENLLATLEIVSLSEDDYRVVLEHLSQQSVAGGATYDALIAYTASKARQISLSR